MEFRVGNLEKRAAVVAVLAGYQGVQGRGAKVAAQRALAAQLGAFQGAGVMVLDAAMAARLAADLKAARRAAARVQ